MFAKRQRRRSRNCHDAQLVFGDVREPDVMLSGDEVFLIGFDRAGKVNEVQCPLLNLSRSVKWLKEVKELEAGYILTGHDQVAVPSQIIRIDSVWWNIEGSPNHEQHSSRVRSRTKNTSDGTP